MYNSIVLSEEAYLNAVDSKIITDLEGLSVNIIDKGEKPKGKVSDPYVVLGKRGEDKGKATKKCYELGLEGKLMDSYLPSLEKGKLSERFAKWVGRNKGAIALGTATAVTAALVANQMLNGDLTLTNTIKEQVEGEIVYHNGVVPTVTETMYEKLNPEAIYAGIVGGVLGLGTALYTGFNRIINRGDYKKAEKAYDAFNKLEDYVDRELIDEQPTERRRSITPSPVNRRSRN